MALTKDVALAGHLAMTYSALALLCICDRGLAGVDVAGAKALVRAMQAKH